MTALTERYHRLNETDYDEYKSQFFRIVEAKNILRDIPVYKDVTWLGSRDNRLRDSRIRAAYPKHLKKRMINTNSRFIHRTS